MTLDDLNELRAELSVAVAALQFHCHTATGEARNKIGSGDGSLLQSWLTSMTATLCFGRVDTKNVTMALAFDVLNCQPIKPSNSIKHYIRLQNTLLLPSLSRSVRRGWTMRSGGG